MEAVDSYLYSVGRLGLEQTFYDGCISDRVSEQVAERASIEPELVHRTVEDDGGASESYRGVLTVAGLQYSFAVSLFADLDGAYFIANISSFDG
jgi:hypothetical protein